MSGRPWLDDPSLPEELRLRRLVQHLGLSQGRPDKPPTIEPVALQGDRKSWGEEMLVAHAPGLYTGKVLRRYASQPYHRAGLQFHVSKDETFYLHSGVVVVYFVDVQDELRMVHMTPGMSFHVPPGAIHSVHTLTDSVMFEASNPVFDDRVRVEHLFDVTKAKPWP